MPADFLQNVTENFAPYHVICKSPNTLLRNKVLLLILEIFSLRQILRLQFCNNKIIDN